MSSHQRRMKVFFMFAKHVVRPLRPRPLLQYLRVRSISIEPQVGFTNNSAQMSSMMSRCAVRMFDQGHFNVKVILYSTEVWSCNTL